ncbi:hypothetical protein PV08_06966 [Exophiala spinifera]|uniref:Zn(2)-C6 fungal-type domain-containing protein n=1 Tax=Exophiala spinifera TaxID=91928 RepID=A0A0D2B659_9EURO|nr:uncharacterized protein PV08_06966 [Exophiala spinifera]KIW14185.1 hypothetical protein PV08_06966 [Exophiala spinifera]
MARRANAANNNRATASSAPVRTRTGCLTCRRRKLKCDEAAPVCGQCQKSGRACERGEGVAFRHQQNASMERDESLKSFYNRDGNERRFRQDTRFVPIPQNLTWVTVDPSSEDAPTNSPSPNITAADPYQQVAAHTLEALSTAAADHVSYPPQATAYYTAMAPHTTPHPEYGFVRLEHEEGPSSNHTNFPNSQNNNANMMIDPNLETTVAGTAEEAGMMEEASGPNQAKHGGEGHLGQGDGDEIGDSESRVAMALQHFNET